MSWQTQEDLDRAQAELSNLEERRDAAVAACRLVHEATRSGGLYVARDPTARAAAGRALDAVRAVLGIAPTAEAPSGGDPE